MEKKFTYYDFAPSVHECRLYCGMPRHTVRVDISEIAADEHPPFTHRAREVTLPEGVWGYDTLVSALVKARYDDDRMTAIINNRMAEPDDADIAAEWEEMQQWRREAKALAKQIIANYNDSGNG